MQSKDHATIVAISPTLKQERSRVRSLAHNTPACDVAQAVFVAARHQTSKFPRAKRWPALTPLCQLCHTLNVHCPVPSGVSISTRASVRTLPPRSRNLPVRLSRGAGYGRDVSIELGSRTAPGWPLRPAFSVRLASRLHGSIEAHYAAAGVVVQTIFRGAALTVHLIDQFKGPKNYYDVVIDDQVVPLQRGPNQNA